MPKVRKGIVAIPFPSIALVCDLGRDSSLEFCIYIIVCFSLSVFNRLVKRSITHSMHEGALRGLVASRYAVYPVARSLQDCDGMGSEVSECIFNYLVVEPSRPPSVWIGQYCGSIERV